MASTRLTDILKVWGLLDSRREAQAVAVHRQRGWRIGEVLVRLGFCSREKVLRALAAQAGLGLVDLRHVRPEQRAVALVPKELAKRYRVLPLSLGSADERVLVVALAAPVSPEALEALEERTGRRVAAFIADEAQLVFMIQHVYEGASSYRRAVELRPAGPGEDRPDARPQLLDIPLIEYLYGAK